jgi:hypothetical protein
MDIAMDQRQQAPLREVVRDRRGTAIGRIERQSQTGKLVARNEEGTLAGVYDPRSGETRDRRGRVVGRTNLLPVLLFIGQ